MRQRQRPDHDAGTPSANCVAAAECPNDAEYFADELDGAWSPNQVRHKSVEESGDVVKRRVLTRRFPRVSPIGNCGRP